MYVFSTLVFEVLWETLRLPLMPARIAVDQHGMNEEERRRFVREAEAEITRLRIGSLREVKPGLADLLGVLARHDRALGWRELVGSRHRAYLAASGSFAAQAIIVGEQVQVSRQHADHLITSLLGLLPAVPLGRGRAFSIPVEAYQRAVQLAADGKGTMEQRNLLRGAGVRADQAEQLELMTRTTVNTGSISVHRGKNGAVTLAGSLAYTDTTRGRYLLLQRPDRAGNSYMSIVPADEKVLNRHIAELLGTAVPW